MTQKILFFSVFVLLLFIVPTRSVASNIQGSDVCNAPPPDSFRITGASTNFISLKWRHTWQGATYNLNILKKDAAGSWSSFYMAPNISNNYYEFITSEPGGTEFRFMIATNCNPGDPSSLTSSIDGITLILELVIGGRNPINPIYVNCTDIPLGIYPWVGFRVTRFTNEGLVSNIFEYVDYNEPNTPSSNPTLKMRIKRVNPYPNNPIVAANPSKEFPTGLDIVKSPSPILMLDESVWPDDNIGRIAIDRLFNPPSISICVSNHDPVWDFDNYYFEPLVAFKTESASNLAEERTFELKKPGFSVQNPFDEVINIFPLNSTTNLSVELFSLNGQLLSSRNFDLVSETIQFPCPNVSSGLYVIRIRTDRYTQNFILTKI